MRCSRFALFACALVSTAYAQNTPSQHQLVFLTHRKVWLASGGFNAKAKDQSKQDPKQVDFSKDFRKRCPQVTVTDTQSRADYAITIDEIGIVSGLTNPNAPTFQVAVYSRNAGVIYMGGTAFLKNAIKDACNSIATSK